jgi:hypothetical protein
MPTMTPTSLAIRVASAFTSVGMIAKQYTSSEHVCMQVKKISATVSEFKLQPALHKTKTTLHKNPLPIPPYVAPTTHTNTHE